jgi:hypothetical protein
MDRDTVADLLHRYLDEWLLGDELGLDIMVNEGQVVVGAASVNSGTTLILFADLLEKLETSRRSIGESVHAAVKKEHDHQRKILAAIQPPTWTKFLVSRFLGWLLVPAVIAAGFVYLLDREVNQRSTEQLWIINGMTRDTKTMQAFTEQLKATIELAERASRNAELTLGVAALAGLPEVKTRMAQNGLALGPLNKDKVKVVEAEDGWFLQFNPSYDAVLDTRSQAIEGRRAAEEEAKKIRAALIVPKALPEEEAR